MRMRFCPFVENEDKLCPIVENDSKLCSVVENEDRFCPIVENEDKGVSNFLKWQFVSHCQVQFFENMYKLCPVVENDDRLVGILLQILPNRDFLNYLWLIFQR